MTRIKQAADLAKLLYCILAVITLSLFWDATVSKAENTVPIDRTLAAVQKMEAPNIKAQAEKETTSKESSERVHKNKVSGTEQDDIPIIVSDVFEAEAADCICSNANRGGSADRKETDVLIRLINAEAYGLSYKAKVAVGQVVMNRWTGPYYGDDLLAIMTAPYQFTPIYNGSAYEKEIEPDSIKAAYTVLEGNGINELTNDTYYFLNPDFTEDKTIEQKMDFVCEIEGIHFYKPPAK